MEIWQTILIAFGGPVVLFTVLGFLAKSLLSQWMVRNAKQFESDLNAKSDATIEHLKSELQLKAVEHQVRFSRLHEKRASVIAELYGHLVEAIWGAESFLSPVEWTGEPNKEEKHRIAMNKLADVYRYFDKHKIYLPPELCASLDELIQHVRSHVIKFGVYVEYPVSDFHKEIIKEKREAWASGWDAINTQVPLARQKLEDEFRALLGAVNNIAAVRDAIQEPPNSK